MAGLGERGRGDGGWGRGDVGCNSLANLRRSEDSIIHLGRGRGSCCSFVALLGLIVCCFFVFLSKFTGLPRCKNMLIFSLFRGYCLCALYYFGALCCLARSLYYVTGEFHKFLHRG